ncbi:thiamine-monophosphate kinase [Flexivirga endophytica]|uniref:Thiamine-monophosphate kinase n=1 Tax=Flexivirga endophytica TaxID=1849103 RepID=A0A916TD11_9MICO|nr:thiamine-phosphate kinase [Flexivirga endophytica]GGB39808.1 thiamine-monophosphate kinase [Flexivirga endophytica]GHB47725.1 thiamine-monophosphate kinase [Flexivirga endophytica]
MTQAPDTRTLADVDEQELLDTVLPRFAASDDVLIGPGDDTALLRVRSGASLATTDTMVLGRDWLDEWSDGADVGHKLVVQNVADIAAMGGRCTGLLVTLVADEGTRLQWVADFTTGVAAAARDAGTVVVGGDLSSAPAGTRMVSITAFGELDHVEPVLRSGARPGDVLAVHGTLGRAAAGLLLLQRGTVETNTNLVQAQRRPSTAYEQGPAAARAGATAMLDISDGLLRDGGRIARASGVRLDIDPAALAGDIQALTAAVGAADAETCVLTGGEEHSLLATFPSGTLPSGWRVIGVVTAGSGITVGGQEHVRVGWDHFGSAKTD